MDINPGAEELADPEPAAASTFSVDARGATGVQVGEHATQIIYSYDRQTVTDAVAPPPLVDITGKVESPYRGLGAFEERDAVFFFGREAAATEVLARITRCLVAPSLLVMSGVSGAGKSSLLRAGVLPRLRGSGVAGAPGSMSWPCVVLTPGRDPLNQLAVRVAPLARTDASIVRQGLDADPTRFALTAAQATMTDPDPSDRHHRAPTGDQRRRLVLLVDQFEQVFTHCLEEAHRQAFITALYAAAGGHGNQPAALVVLVVRADFEARCADHPALTDAVQDRYLLTSMTQRQLRMAITEPAKKTGSRVDDDLVTLLLDEIRTRAVGPPEVGKDGGTVMGSGVLPLLSHALDQAWRSRAGDILTIADYERTGGIERAVADSAQGAYDRLSPTQQLAARQIFLRLTATTSDGADTADRVTRTELTHGKNGVQVRDVEAVLESFAAERLLILAADTVEISHEALLTAWPLLRAWLAETRDNRIVRTRLRTAAAEWAGNARDPSYLYRDSQLAVATDVATGAAVDPTHQQPLNDTEQAFLHASRRADRRRQRRRTSVIALLTVLVVGLAAATGLAYGNRQQADHQRDVAISGELIAQSEVQSDVDPLGAKVESLAAWSLNPSPEARYALLAAATHPLRTIFTNPGRAVTSIVFSPDNRIIASGSEDGVVLLRDAATGNPIRQLPANPNEDPFTDVMFSPDGKTLATVGRFGSARLWDVATGHQTGQLSIDLRDQVTSVAFSPDGKTLVTGTDGVVRLWNVTTGQIGQLSTDPNQAVTSLVFGPDGKTLATGSEDGVVRLWDVAAGHQTGQPLTLPDGPAVSSPDGKILAIFRGGGLVLWDVAAGHQISQLPIARNDTGGPVAFSPDDQTLAMGSAVGVVRLWDVATGRQTGQLPATPDGLVTSVVFSPDGRILAMGSDGGVVRLWNSATGHQIGQQAGHQISKLLTDLGDQVDGGGDPLQVNSVVLSKDRKTLAIGSDDGVVRLWDVATGHQTGQLPIDPNEPPPTSVALSLNAQTLAISDGSVVRLWDMTTAHQISQPLTIPGDHQIVSVALSPDGKTLAAGGVGGVWLWDVATGRQLNRLPNGSRGVVSVVFGPDGEALAAGGGNDGTVWLWDVATGHSIGQPFTNPEAEVLAVALSPDGKTLAISEGDSTRDPDGTVRLWDVATGHQIGQPLTSTDSEVLGMMFSRDGRTLITSEAGGVGGTYVTVRLWNVDYLADLLPQLCAQVGGSVTPAMWAHYVPSGPAYHNICS